MSYKVLHHPLSPDQILQQAKCHNNWIEGVVDVTLNELTDYGYENFLDLICDRLANYSCLTDIEYFVVGFKVNKGASHIHLHVRANASELVENILDAEPILFPDER